MTFAPQRLGLKDQTKHRLIFNLLAIVFEVYRARGMNFEVRPLKSGLLEDFYNQFCPYNWIIRKLMELKSFPFCILAALPIGGTSNTINTSSLLFFPLSTFHYGKVILCTPDYFTSF